MSIRHQYLHALDSSNIAGFLNLSGCRETRDSLDTAERSIHGGPGHDGARSCGRWDHGGCHFFLLLWLVRFFFLLLLKSCALFKIYNNKFSVTIDMFFQINGPNSPPYHEAPFWFATWQQLIILSLHWSKVMNMWRLLKVNFFFKSYHWPFILSITNVHILVTLSNTWLR